MDFMHTLYTAYSVLGTPYEKSFKNTISYFSVYVPLDMGLEIIIIQLFYI